MAIEHRIEDFTIEDLEPVLASMVQFAVGAQGDRWVNIVPAVDVDDIATGSVFARVFSSRGPVVPMATWQPEYQHRGSHQPTQVGLVHAAGSGAVPRLTERGVVAPPDWVLVQDHQRRGVIFAVPPGPPVRATLVFIATALEVLSPFSFERSFVATFSRR